LVSLVDLLGALLMLLLAAMESECFRAESHSSLYFESLKFVFWVAPEPSKQLLWVPISPAS